MRLFRAAFVLVLVALLLAPAAKSASTAQPRPTSIVLLSDIHFNPFQDPATVALLIARPISAWDKLFDSQPATPDLTPGQRSCVAQLDTQYVLFHTGLKAMRAAAAHARFVTVSGDLLAHNFLACYEAFALPETQTADFRFSEPLPLTADQQRAYADFVQKTIAYLAGQFAATFPARPLYYALGNNDSDCGDYLLDAPSDFLRRTAALLTAQLPPAQRRSARTSFALDGDYSVPLPALPNTRLIVLDDLYLAVGYGPCPRPPGSGPALPSDPAGAQLAWLKAQLASAEAHHQRVWVMGHIPPGLNLYETVGSGHPVSFLKPAYDLAPMLTATPGLVRLGIFAHTHLDGMSNLDATPPVPLKSVQSISPNHGNAPAFTLAHIDPRTSALLDYTIIAATLTDRHAQPALYTWPAFADWPTHPTWPYLSSTGP